VTFTGYVPDADLVHLYQAASCLVLPSRDEGFGLPVVEAMACGTPVVASRAGSLPELVGDAGLLVAPERVDDLARALSRLVSQPALRATLRERGLQRAAQLSWEQAADDLLAVFRELAPAPRRLAGQLQERGAQHA
jgi:glycosyltransferase involved in cell wall biosynthesis